MVVGDAEQPKHPGGRPKNTTDYRLGRLVKPALEYIEACANGDEVPNASRLALAWRLVQREKDNGPTGSSDPYAEMLKKLPKVKVVGKGPKKGQSFDFDEGKK